jgi:hypothetical protein
MPPISPKEDPLPRPWEKFLFELEKMFDYV